MYELLCQPRQNEYQRARENRKGNTEAKKKKNDVTNKPFDDGI